MNTTHVKNSGQLGRVELPQFLSLEIPRLPVGSTEREELGFRQIAPIMPDLSQEIALIFG